MITGNIIPQISNCPIKTPFEPRYNEIFRGVECPFPGFRGCDIKFISHVRRELHGNFEYYIFE